MKIGMNLMLWTASPDISKHGIYLEKMKEWGYDTFEVGVGGLDTNQIKGFAQKSVELGMEPHCCDLYSVDEADLIGLMPEQRKKAVTRIKDSIHKTRDMGAKVLSGPILQGLGRSTAIGATTEEWNWLVEGMGECAVEAKECGVKIAVEPLNRFEMYIMNTIGKAYQLCQEVDETSLGILADTHHSNIEELNIIETYVQYVDKIYLVHISENDRGIPGSGHAVPRELFKCMKVAGYKGDWVIEAFNANVEELKPLVRVWNKFAETEDEIAIEGLRYIKKNL